LNAAGSARHRIQRGKEVHDNSAYVNLMCKRALREAVAGAERKDCRARPAWTDIADRLVVPMYGDGGYPGP